ncbi:DUF3450 domain-containing protein [Candidatus Venteria ishoeyi]|uniref:DUF3450 domain-containing protein n=1 Tax=Candidatus Venteria ishoeyi TaxID=1899563 RepID=UPI0025A557AA|nr:DUF3450 domain-containing protein [Candidatus Venteria ishoeyi]MDM8546001.1 DUF3450 domain-containing protein [Candidatus Venteria ishoeyi]
MKPIFFPLCGLILFSLAPLAHANSETQAPEQVLDAALQTQQDIQQANRSSQQQVEQLDDETQVLFNEYQQVNAEIKRLKVWNQQLQRQQLSQQQAFTDLAQQQQRIAQNREQLSPMLEEMHAVLTQFVRLDLPFLPEERQLRLKALRELLDNNDTPLPEKYRRMLEAWQVEMEYGRALETWTATLADGEQVEQLSQFLRLGRVALYRLSLDGQQAHYWDAARKNWIALNAQQADNIDKAIRIAKKQMPAQLLRLIIPRPMPPSPAAPEDIASEKIIREEAVSHE